MSAYLSCSPLATCCSLGCSFADGHLDTSCCPLAQCAPLRTCMTQSVSYAIVTGGNRSIGFETARSLVQRGHKVILLCRNNDLGIKAAKSIESTTCCKAGSVLVRIADLGDIKSIQNFCNEFEQGGAYESKGYGGYDDEGNSLLIGASVHILVNNAGMIGRECVIVNHFGHFVLTLGLLKPILKGVQTYGGSTVVHVGSTAHSMSSPGLSNRFSSSSLLDDGKRFDDWSEYCDSKAANIIFTKTLARILDHHKVRCVSYHPGVLLTDLWRPPSHQNSPPTEGAQLSIPRMIFSCCVKHPKISAAGLSSLSDPRCHSLHHSTCRGLTVGHGGGYYQQLCCCMVMPVRPMFSYNLSNLSPSLPISPSQDSQGENYNMSLESSLWVASMRRLLDVSPDMFATIQTSLRSLSPDHSVQELSQKSILLNPACACTEPLAMAPLCVCTTCLC